jgi:alpha-glucosidase
VYLYQGEELGLPEVLDLPDEVREDPVFARTGGRQKGRDGCRIPLPWSAAADRAHGFSDHPPRRSPWLPQPADWGTYAVDRQEGDPVSMLTLYRRLIAARRERLVAGEAELADDHDDVVVVRRGRVVVACNTGRQPVDVAAVRGLTPVLTTGAPADAGIVPPDTTVWFVP